MNVLQQLRWILVDEFIGHDRVLEKRLRQILPDLEDVVINPRGGAFARLAVPVGTEECALDLLSRHRLESIIAGPGMIAVYVVDGVRPSGATAHTQTDRDLLSAFRAGYQRFGPSSCG